jgi:exosome complex exonuclease RRP6
VWRCSVETRRFLTPLQQHSYRSFQGFCCLMQISTREEDFLIDALELRSHMHLLNEPFTNPKIVKVYYPHTYISISLSSLW